jgi:nucleoside diphosphate kinase
MPANKSTAALGILKPDAVARKLNERIYTDLRLKNLWIRVIEGRTLEGFESDLLYPHCMEKPFYSKLREFTTSGPSEIFMIYGFGSEERMDGIKKCIRSKYHIEDQWFPKLLGSAQNLIHTSYEPHELDHFLRIVS